MGKSIVAMGSLNFLFLNGGGWVIWWFRCGWSIVMGVVVFGWWCDERMVCRYGMFGADGDARFWGCGFVLFYGGLKRRWYKGATGLWCIESCDC